VPSVLGTLCWLGVRKTIWPAKHWVTRWRSYLSAARCKWFAHGPADHPITSCFIEIQTGLTFLVPAYSRCPGKDAVKRVTVSLSSFLDHQLIRESWEKECHTFYIGCLIALHLSLEWLVRTEWDATYLISEQLQCRAVTRTRPLHLDNIWSALFNTLHWRQLLQWNWHCYLLQKITSFMHCVYLNSHDMNMENISLYVYS